MTSLAALVINSLILALAAMAYFGLSSRMARLEDAMLTRPAPVQVGTAAPNISLGGSSGRLLPYGTASEGVSLRLSAHLGAARAANGGALARTLPPARSAPLAQVARETSPPPQAAPVQPSPVATEPAPASPRPSGAQVTVEDQPGQSWIGRVRSAISGSPDNAEVMSGMRDALRLGTDAAVARLGTPGGYKDDDAVRIRLPRKLEAVRNVLKSVGMATLMDALQSQMNEAAELTANYTGQVFHKAINEMPPASPERLLSGSQAATDHLESRMKNRIISELKPVIEARLAEVGALDTYDQAMGVYGALPFVPTIDGDLSNFVTTKVMDAVFYYVGENEQIIRQDPDYRSTPALRAVFGDS